MSKWDRPADEFDRDMVIAFWSPRFKHVRPIEALAELRRRRLEYV